MGRDAFEASDSKVMAADYRLNIDEEEINVDAAFARDDDIEFHELIANAEDIDDYFIILHSESMAGNARRVKAIVSAYADKNILVKVDSNKETALHVAADCGHTEVVEVLLDAARQLPSSSANDDSHHLVTAEDFIRQPNDSMNTALHLAVSNGHMAIAKLLVKADPGDRHIQNSMSETPIYLAAKLGYEEIVQMICETCTAPALDGPDGTTALHAAIMMLTEGKNDGLAVVKALTAAARSSASSANGSYSSVRSFLRKSNEKDKDTALHLAVRRNHLGVAKHILDVDPSLLIKNKQSDFKSTIYKAAELGYTDMVTLLCKRYDEVQNKLVHKDLIGLCAAIVGRNAASVIDILKKANHLVTYDDDKGWTPLHYAAYYEFDSILDIIIEAQASIKWEVVYKEKVPTPLCVAAKEGHTSTVIQLMQLLPDSCIIPNYEDQNILHLAAVQNNTKMVHGILKHCPEEYTKIILDGRDVNGNTPLHLLICQGCFIPELIPGLTSESTDNSKWPVDMMTTNNKGWTPADMLYFEDEIIGDQLKIKSAFDYIQSDKWAEWKFWKSISNKKAISVPLKSIGRSSTRESLVPLSIRSRKDAEIDKVIKEMMNENVIRFRQMDNSQIVITALITTITFTVGFTMPGGLHQSGESNQGSAILSKKKAFEVFIVSDALAFLLSSTCLFLYFLKIIYGQDMRQIAKLEGATAGLNMYSVFAMIITFISGTYVVLSHTPALANTVVIICSLFFGLFYVLAFKAIIDRKMN